MSCVEAEPEILCGAVASLAAHWGVSPEAVRVAPAGSGGQFQVYRVEPPWGGPLCLKVERNGHRGGHLGREGRFLAALRSRHVPGLVLDATPAGFLLEEWIEGERLDRASRDSLQPRLASLVGGLAQVLADLAVAAVVHRDVKPRNLFLRAGEILLLDFGSAELEGSRTGPAPATAGKLGRGTHVLQPLEQLTGQPYQDRRADVFAAAGVVFFLLTGSPPFDNSQADPAAAWRHYRRYEGQLARRLARWPDAVSTALCRALRVDPEERPRDLWEVAAAFRGESWR